MNSLGGPDLRTDGLRVSVFVIYNIEREHTENLTISFFKEYDIIRPCLIIIQIIVQKKKKRRRNPIVYACN